MEWFSDLFTSINSVGHIVFIYAMVIAVGVALGKIKLGGISLGVTFVLFAGIVVGHFYKVFGPADLEYAVPAAVLSFIQDFGLILFVYCIGLQVGPGFFASFKQGGIRLNILAVSIVLLNILVMLALYFIFFDTSDTKNLPMMVGVMCGAVTNTPGLGAAAETLREVFGDNLPTIMSHSQITSGYACAYPLGVVGIILSTILIRFVCKINLQDEEKKIQQEIDANPHSKPHHMTVEVTNPNIMGKSLQDVQSFLSRDFVCSYFQHNDMIEAPSSTTVLHQGDLLRMVCAEDDAEAIIAFIGQRREDVQLQKADSPIISKRILVTQPSVNGKTFGEMHFRSLYGVNVTRITRSGMEIFASRNLRLQIGDRIMVVGTEDAVNRIEGVLGNSIKRLDHPNVGAIFIGIMLGVILGSIPLSIAGVPNPVKLGLAGGPLVIAILVGRYGYKFKIISYTTTSANLLLREIGLILFLASVGIKAGAGFWNTVMEGDGLMYVWTGFLITIIPLLIVGLVARIRYKMNYFTLMGLIAGSCTDPPALAFAQQTAGNDAPSVSYSTVYPLTMFLRILAGQMIILFLC